MMTIASIIDSQKPETKLRFHFAVVHDFDVKHMLKIYSLRGRIRDDIEFNFYNAKKSEIELRNLNPKDPGAVAKLLLPNLLPKDVERLIVFDTGDLLVLRDLTIMYNWKMDNYICLGIPGGKIRKYAMISKKKYKRYINTGSILINVKKYKYENIYEKCVKNKDIYHNEIADQDLLNDILFGKIGYLPFKFGMRSPYGKDVDSDIV
jgi:lipopolysaccharide biosynthesis glycosyltransferase